jgi:hypothetical protein
MAKKTQIVIAIVNRRDGVRSDIAELLLLLLLLLVLLLLLANPAVAKTETELIVALGTSRSTFPFIDRE